MVVALVTVNNWPEELPLLIACLLLVWLGGGLLSVYRLLDRGWAPVPPGLPSARHATSEAGGSAPSK